MSEEVNNQMFIYSEIGGFGVYAEEVISFLKENEGKDVEFFINSPGGSVFQGIAIYEAINRHKGKVITHIDGLAASISSVFPLASDRIVMSKGGFFMIHNPFSFAFGEEEDMKKEAKVLNKIKQSLVNIYKGNSNLPEEEISNLMDKETWFSAQEALEAGFIDEIVSSERKIAASWNFDKKPFFNIPEKLMKSQIEYNSIYFDGEKINEKESFEWMKANGFDNSNRDTVEIDGKKYIHYLLSDESLENKEPVEFLIDDGVKAISYKERKENMYNQAQLDEAVNKAKAEAFEEGKKAGIEEEAAKFDDKMNQIVEAEAKRVNEIKECSFEGQEELVEKLISDKIDVNEAAKALLIDYKEKQNNVEEKTTVDDAREILNELDSAAPESVNPDVNEEISYRNRWQAMPTNTPEEVRAKQEFHKKHKAAIKAELNFFKKG